MQTLERKKAPVITDAVNFKLHLKPYQHFKLNNGVDVYAINAGAEDVMAIEWVFFAGNAYEEKNLVAASTSFLLKGGTTQRNAFALSEYFDFYGAFFNRACYNETATLSLHCLSKHVGELLPVVREVITDSILPQDELDIYRDNMKQRLKVSLQKSDFVADRLIDTYIYGESHPYGKYSKEEDFNALTREELIAFYNYHYKEGKFIVFVAGKLPANIETLLNIHFGDLPNKPIEDITIAGHTAQEKKYRITNDNAAVQGSIRMARPFPDRHHPDFLKTLVLNTVFGGFFGSRLMLNIREEKGYTYSIQSYLQNHVHDTAWVVSTEAGKDVCESAIEETFKEMSLLQQKKIGAKELLLVRNFLMGGLLSELDGPFQLIARWKNIILNNLDEDYFNSYVETIKSVSPKELQQLAQQYLNKEDFYNLVVY